MTNITELRMDYRDFWLERLARKMSQPSLVFNGDGLCFILLDKNILVSIIKKNDNNDLVIIASKPVDFMNKFERFKNFFSKNTSNYINGDPIYSINIQEEFAFLEAVIVTNEGKASEIELEKLIECIDVEI